MIPDRDAVIAAHRASLEAQKAALDASAESAQDAMRVDGDHRPDSRGERGAVSAAGALRAGLLGRAAEVEAALAQMDALAPGRRERVVLGAIVRLDDGDEERWLAVLPGGDGRRVSVDGVTVSVVSAQAPLVRALWGAEEGDAAEVRRPGGVVEVEVVAIG